VTTTNENDYPNSHLITDIDWVEQNLDSRNVVLLDARGSGYENGHIPGAIAYHVKELKDDKNYGFVSADDLRKGLEARGINEESTVIVYDDGAGVTAARVFYVLEVFGLKDRVKLLNGGYAAWVAAGKPTSVDTPVVSPSSIEVVPNESGAVYKTDLQAGLRNAIILDVRSAQEFSGEDKRSNRKGGHLIGAIHKEWKDALDSVDENGVTRFKSYPELKRDFEAVGVNSEHTIVPYCQSNQRGAHTYFVLRLLGYSDVRPYEGSWDEWGNADDTEVER
jgi:thiosulfate/3-mercaptopyruvate sulfurtransferase